MWKKFKQRILYNLFRSAKTVPLKEIQIHETAYTIRSITTDDLKALMDVQRNVYQGETPWGKSAFLFELNNFYPHLYLGVFQGKQLVAFIGCRVRYHDAHITNFAVRTEVQNQGLGTFLMEEAIQYALQNQCQQMSLEVKQANQDAQRLYRRFGFVTKRIHKNYYADQQDALEMIWRMTEDVQNHPETRVS